MGEWLQINGDAIYSTVPWSLAQNDTSTPGVWYTASKSRSDKIYAILTTWTGTNVTLGSVIVKPDSKLSIGMLGMKGNLPWKKAAGTKQGIIVEMPRKDETMSKWAWTLVIKGI